GPLALGLGAVGRLLLVLLAVEDEVGLDLLAGAVGRLLVRGVERGLVGSGLLLDLGHAGIVRGAGLLRGRRRVDVALRVPGHVGLLRGGLDVGGREEHGVVGLRRCGLGHGDRGTRGVRRRLGGGVLVLGAGAALG